MRPFTPDDLYLHRKVTHLHAQPGVPWAAASVRSAEREQDSYQSCLWAFPADGEPRQLTHGPGLDTSPRWSPDGAHLGFLSTRGGGAPQLHVLPPGGGDARQVGGFELGAMQLRWSHDGRALLATAAQAVDPEGRGRRGGPAPERNERSPEVCWRLPYKSDGVGYLLRREIHLFRVELDTGNAHRLTDGPFDVFGFAPSPDGRQIAYSRSREGRFAHRTDLWLCDVDCSVHRRLTDGHALVTEPVWSPDGRTIAFAGAVKDGDAQLRLWSVDVASGQVRPLGPEGLEVADSESLHWRADGSELLLVRAHRGRHEIVAIDVRAGALRILAGGDRQVGGFACDGEHLFFTAETPVAPSEVQVCGAQGGPERRIGQLNPWWNERVPLRLEALRFDVPDGQGGQETIDGWLLRAEHSEGPLPLLTDVHGGPASYALLDYDSNPYWQALCSQGWAVLMLNAVGSASFGDEFCSRLAGRWGELDLPQHQAALRQLQHEGVCDERIAIAGKSYGGFFTSWALGHCDQFRAAVVMAPVGNIETHYGTSDGGYYADPLYLDTAPAFDRARAQQLSPLHYIEKATTPTLFLQGKEDERTPKCQAEELFVSLYRAGQTPAELVLYPGEGHTFLSGGMPACRRDANQRIVDWLSRYIGPGTAPVAPAAHLLEEDALARDAA